MTIHEPATFLTDLLLAGLAGELGWRLWRSSPSAHAAARWWSRAFFLTALSAIVGGSYHGFSRHVSPDIAGAWWRVTLLLLNFVSAAIGLSWACEVVPPRSRPIVFFIVTLKLILFAVFVLRSPVFLVAISDYGSTIAAWGIAAIVLRRKWSNWMLVGLALSGLSAMVQQLRWAPAAWFNHNDLYHLIQMLALIALYRAARHFDVPTR